jgi:hypothetical protein
VNGTSYIEHEASAKIVRGGSAAEGVAGVTGIVLAILGLLGILPNMLLPIATIVLGVGFLLEGGTIASRFSNLLKETAKGRFETSELSVGLTTELIGGITAITLGILTLINISPAVLMPVAAIVFGSTLLFGSGVTARLNHLREPKSDEYEAFRNVAREAVGIATGVRIFLGLSAVVLGIIALAGVNWMILTFVSILCVGVSDLMSGSALTARMFGVMHRQTS